MLAAECLRTISPDCVLELSHMDIVSELTRQLNVGADCVQALLKCIGDKNLHGLAALCRENGADAAASEALKRLMQTCGTPEEVRPALRALDIKLSRLEQL